MNIPTPDEAAKLPVPELSKEEELTLSLLEIPQHIKQSEGEKISYIPRFFVIDAAGCKREKLMCANEYAIDQASNILKPRGWLITQEHLREDIFRIVLTPDPNRRIDLEDELVPPPKLTLSMKIKLFIVKLLRKLV